MAARANPAARPEVNDILLVIHDFAARSSDELSLAKGDRVELIERDDEFGDGWYLGKHLVNGNTGLFPEVYTRPAPKGVSAVPPVTLLANSSTSFKPSLPASTSIPPTAAGDRAPLQLTSGSSYAAPLVSATPSRPDPAPVTLPLNANRPDDLVSSVPLTNTAPLAGKSLSGPQATNNGGRLTTGSQDHPVLHETLTVIDEHITDLKSTPSNGALNHSTDSGSEYSSQFHDRLSYIQGEETDEEEEAPHTREEVSAWTADDVAEFLFTVGVEKKHCEVFRDQEISGEVLLGMDQSSLFLKAFDLGSVGRRLKTWQKIKSLQDEVNGVLPTSKRNTSTYGSETGTEGHARMRSRTNTLTRAPSRMSAMDDRPASVAGRRISQTPKVEPVSPLTPVSPNALIDSPSRTSHQHRPSAASVRDLNHSRRHSSTDFRLTGTTLSTSGTPKLVTSGTFPLGETGPHKKQPSFDRNWTMGGASGGTSQRPLSSTGFRGAVHNNSEENVIADTSVDLDRGYFSGTELDGRRRNVLKKRDSIAGHSTNSSYTEEQRMRAATALTRHSRYGSVDSVGVDSMPPSASQKYYGVPGSHRRSMSTKTVESIRPVPPAKDDPSPTVTKLDNFQPDGTRESPASGGGRQEWEAKPAKMGSFGGLRAISDAITGGERAKIASTNETSLKDSPLQSPSRTGSSTPSGGLSFELDSPEASKSPLSASIGAQARRPTKKTKQETSAYLRGLAKTNPREAIPSADYSGWMKKKSSHLMTTWKPRLFVLKGRRLAYYYSEDDTEEKGLIDISFHRVLPADNDRLTGLHATLTGAGVTPIMPADSNLKTGADAAAMAALDKTDDSMFIFKLVPPRAGLSRAVNFTKPTVHYFAVPNLQQGRAWMAALMKATIDRDENGPMKSTYQQKTISLAKARQMRHRPPALMNLDEQADSPVAVDEDVDKKNGLGISFGEVDSAVSGLEKLGLQRVESASARQPDYDTEKGPNLSFLSSPQSA